MSSTSSGQLAGRLPFTLESFGRAHVPILGSILLLFLLEILHVLAPLERMEFDLLVGTRLPRIADVTAVMIDNDDYASHFDSRSPLRADALRKLIEAVLKGRPTVLGIDIDTAHPSFVGTMDNLPTTTPIVWARGGSPCRKSETNPVGARLPLRIEPIDKSCVMPGGVLGMPVPPPSLIHGLTVFFADVDGVVRRFRPTLPTQYGDVPAFSTMLRLLHSHRDIASIAQPSEERYLDFSGPPLTVPAVSMKYVLKHAQDAAWESAFAGHIVVIGGKYDEARDVVVTSSGQMYGVQLVAQAAGAWTLEEPIKPSHLWSMVAEYVCGIAAFVILSMVPRRRLSWILVLIAIPLLACLTSLVFFATYTHWLRFASVVVGLYTEQLWHPRA